MVCALNRARDFSVILEGWGSGPDILMAMRTKMAFRASRIAYTGSNSGVDSDTPPAQKSARPNSHRARSKSHEARLQSRVARLQSQGRARATTKTRPYF